MTDITKSRSPSDGMESTGQVAKEQATKVGHTAVEGGGQVLRTAAEQGRQVAGEAGDRARELYGAARDELHGQAGEQQRRAASGLRSLGTELRTMADQGGGSGPATDLARRASGTVDQVAGWLEDREPGAVLNDVRRYAQRHPGVFLAGAALLGVLAGRLTRGLAADAGTNGASGGGRAASDDGGQAIGVATVPPTRVPEPAGVAPADPYAYQGERR